MGTHGTPAVRGVEGGAMAEVSQGTVRVEVARGVMTLTLADAAHRNALGAELVGGLREAIRDANADPAVRAIVITNEGSTFCAGANLKERSSAGDADGAGRPAASSTTPPSSSSGGLVELFQEIRASATPVIGRIAGHAVGGGVGLVAVLDVSIAAEDVKLGFTEVRLGVIPAMISVVCLPKMRPGEAMEAFLRGHRFTAKRAVELGLINRAVPAAELDAAVEEVLADLRKAGPKALGLAKQLVYEVPRRTTEEAFEWTTALSNELFASDEAREGMAAFLGKRAPSWAREEEGDG
jgi:methylglutaconyl-CoA hydratase